MCYPGPREAGAGNVYGRIAMLTRIAFAMFSVLYQIIIIPYYKTRGLHVAAECRA